MKKKILLFSYIILLVFSYAPLSFADEADALYERYLTNNAQNVSLGYLKGSKFSYEAMDKIPIPSSRVSADTNEQLGTLYLKRMTNYTADSPTSNAYISTIKNSTNFKLEPSPEIVGTLSVNELVLAKNEPINSLDPAQYVTISQHMKGGVLSMEWVKKPDTSVIGEQIAQIKVTDRLDGYVQNKTFDIPVKVEDTQLTAEPNPQTVILGTETSSLNPSAFVTNVKIGEQTLTADQYTTQLVDTLTTDIVGTQTVKVKVTLKSDTTKTTDVDVPFNVNWGNTIVAKDASLDKVVVSVSILNGMGQPWLHANRGDGLSLNEVVLARPYLSIYHTDLMNPIAELTYGTVHQSTEHLMNAWNKEFQPINQTLQYGDVLSFTVFKYGVAADNYNGTNTWVARNNALVKETSGYDMAYYEMTKTGLNLLHINQLSTIEGNVPIYASKEFLDKHVSEYIDLKGYSNISVKGFSQYPDTKSAGAQKGKVLVEETLSTGKKAQYEYEVTLNVAPGELTYNVPATLAFQDFSKSREEQIIHRKHSGNLGLSIKDSRGANSQGDWRLMAQIEDSENELAPYFIFRKAGMRDQYLNQGMTEIYAQEKQTNAISPVDVEISGQWTTDTGILLKIPANNHLLAKEYTTTIVWNLVEGP